MTKTTEELKKRLKELGNPIFYGRVTCSEDNPTVFLKDIALFLQSEIEAAEKAKTEAIIKEIEQRYKDSLGIGNNPLVEHLRSKFLNNL